MLFQTGRRKWRPLFELFVRNIIVTLRLAEVGLVLRSLEFLLGEIMSLFLWIRRKRDLLTKKRRKRFQSYCSLFFPLPPSPHSFVALRAPFSTVSIVFLITSFVSFQAGTYEHPLNRSAVSNLPLFSLGAELGPQSTCRPRLTAAKEKSIPERGSPAPPWRLGTRNKEKKRDYDQYSDPITRYLVRIGYCGAFL